ncbi:MAG: oligosaccharide flippase family protein [Paenibacillaceae bacterium]|nr:oligosaccharide flippase family protein [Paenibacillaceae bacterium]
MSKLVLSPNENAKFLLRNVSVVILGLFANQLLETFGGIALARMLHDPVAFGEVNLLLQIFNMIALFLNVGFNSALLFAISVNPEEAKRNEFRYSLHGSLYSSLAIGLLVVFLAPHLSRIYDVPALHLALILGTVLIAFQSIAAIGIAIFSGARSFVSQVSFMVLLTVCSTGGMLLGIACAVRGGTLAGVSLGMGIGSIAATGVVIWRVWKVHAPALRGTVPLRKLAKQLKYGVPLWAGNIAKAFQQPFLVMMIGSSSIVAVGYLTNGLRITGFIGVITWAFMIVAFPFIAEKSADRAEAVKRGTLCVRYNNLLLYPLTLIILLYPDAINGFLFGTSYVSGDSGVYTQLLALGTLFSSVGRLGGNILAGAGRTKANFWAMLASGIVVVALVPLLASDNPLLAMWIYLAGWIGSAASMIGFYYYEGFVLKWRQAFVEPLLPTAAMGAVLGVGNYAGSLFPLFLAAGLLLLVGLTVYLERAAPDSART